MAISFISALDTEYISRSESICPGRVILSTLSWPTTRPAKQNGNIAVFREYHRKRWKKLTVRVILPTITRSI